jgi:hypothetical protein
VAVKSSVLEAIEPYYWLSVRSTLFETTTVKYPAINLTLKAKHRHISHKISPKPPLKDPI